MRRTHGKRTLVRVEEKSTHTKVFCGRRRLSVHIGWEVGNLLNVKDTALLGPSFGMSVKTFESLPLNFRLLSKL